MTNYELFKDDFAEALVKTYPACSFVWARRTGKTDECCPHVYDLDRGYCSECTELNKQWLNSDINKTSILDLSAVQVGDKIRMTYKGSLRKMEFEVISKTPLYTLFLYKGDENNIDKSILLTTEKVYRYFEDFEYV